VLLLSLRMAGCTRLLGKYSLSSPQQVFVGEVAAYTFDKCGDIEYEIELVGRQLAAAQTPLNSGDLNPQQRAAGEKSLIGVRTQLDRL
jgi:hypothetical protein